MATYIRTDLGDLPALIPTWLLDTAVIHTDSEALDITLRLFNAGRGPVWSQTLWAYGGRIPLRLARLTETAIQAEVAEDAIPHVSSIYIEAADHLTGREALGVQADVIWCRSRRAPADILSRFLNYSGTWRIPAGYMPQTAALLAPGESAGFTFTAAVSRAGDPDSLRVVTITDTRANDSARHAVVTPLPRIGDIIRQAAVALQAKVGLIRVHSIRVSAGPRSVNFIVDPDIDPALPGQHSLIASGPFLGQTQYWFITSVSRELTLDASTTVSGARRIRYRARAGSTWKALTMPLTKKEFSDLADIPAAPLARICAGVDPTTMWTIPLADITITGIKASFDPSSDEPAQAEITFLTSAIPDADLNPAPPGRIFTDQYDSRFT